MSAGDLGLIPGLGRAPGEGKGYPLQYFGLENSMDSIDHGVAKHDWATFTSLHFTTFSQPGCWMKVMQWFFLLLFLFLPLKLLLSPPSCLFFLYLLPFVEQIIKKALHGRLRPLLIKTLVNKIVHMLTSWSSYSGGVRLIQLNKWISSVQSLSRVRLFTTPWIAACQASLSIHLKLNVYC